MLRNYEIGCDVKLTLENLMKEAVRKSHSRKRRHLSNNSQSKREIRSTEEIFDHKGTAKDRDRENRIPKERYKQASRGFDTAKNHN